MMLLKGEGATMQFITQDLKVWLTVKRKKRKYKVKKDLHPTLSITSNNGFSHNCNSSHFYDININNYNHNSSSLYYNNVP
eukprot:m.19843 g.19843  ORF g.19843 m.19843 type:complete len:80 (+) comp6689_c0_seq1:1-240(+)